MRHLSKAGNASIRLGQVKNFPSPHASFAAAPQPLIDHQPRVLPTPYFLLPTPYFLLPTPYSLNTEPSTLNRGARTSELQGVVAEGLSEARAKPLEGWRGRPSLLHPQRLLQTHPERRFDHPLFLITYPEHGPVYGGVEGLVTCCLSLAPLSLASHPTS